VAYVSNLGGRKAGARDRSAKQCCDPFAELVRVDARGFAQPGSVMRVDLVAGTVRKVMRSAVTPPASRGTKSAIACTSPTATPTR